MAISVSKFRNCCLDVIRRVEATGESVSLRADVTLTSDRRRLLRHGSRVPLRNLIDYLEGGYSLDEFLESGHSERRRSAKNEGDWVIG